MTKQEKLIVSAYTGILMTNFDDLHRFIEEKLERPIQTIELSDEKIFNELKEKVKKEFIKLCAE